MVNLSIKIHISNFSSAHKDVSVTGVDINSYATSTFITVSNSIFDNAVSIQTSNLNNISHQSASILFVNVLLYNATNSIGNTFGNTETNNVCIKTEDTIVSVMFKNVSFKSTHNTGALLIDNHFISHYPTYPVFIQLINCDFSNNSALDHVVALHINATKNQNHSFNIDIKLINCSFDHNSKSKSIVYVNTPTTDGFYIHNILIIVSNSLFSNNNGIGLYLIIPKFKLEGNVSNWFINNSATNGAAIYLKEVYVISSDDNTNVKFINNFAEQNGGAIYIDLLNLVDSATDHCAVFQNISSLSNVSFIDNVAGKAGNSIYFDVPKGCNIITNVNDVSSLLYVPRKFKYVQRIYTTSPPVVTSPYTMYLYPPSAVVVDHSNHSSNSYIVSQSKMLGEPIQFTASMLDYFGNITEQAIFSFYCDACGDDYVLSTYDQIIVRDHTLHEFKVFPRVPHDIDSSINLSITLTSDWSLLYGYINITLSIELSSCHKGYLFASHMSPPQCVCYPHPDIVHCTEEYSEIKIGYWIGFLTKQHYTSSICPSSYCNFAKRTKTSEGYYAIPSKQDDQCSSHRTGVACGECKSGYTLAYDSPDCINTDKCSAGMTILVIVLTVVYWITIVAGVFGLMYIRFRIPLGYVYAIIYYYSIVDVLLINDVSEVTSQLVRILSSLAKLTPQLFGQLCLVEGLSGIDQQFIHYSHALAISLILLIIVLAAKRSGRLTRFVGPCIIRVICLLLLLSYTSLASTSLQLLRPLTFNDVDEVRTYSSPDIKYFTGRHLVYAIVAILCEVIIVIGLPLFLLLEPLLSRLSQRINLVRIKPLLDEFQDSYKGKYRWFAAYYLICRQVIILIVYVGNGDYYKMLYYLQTACIVIAMVHTCFQPYKNNLLNALDGVTLLLSVLVVNLNTFSFLSAASTIILVLLPLLMLICFVSIRKLFVYCTRRNIVLHLFNPVDAYGEHDDYNNQGR